MSGKRYYRQQDSGRDIYSGASKTNHKRLWIIGGCVLAAVVVVCAVGAGIKMLGDPQVSSEEPGVEQTAERTTFPKGIVVEGIDLEGMTPGGGHRCGQGRGTVLEHLQHHPHLRR